MRRIANGPTHGPAFRREARGGVAGSAPSHWLRPSGFLDRNFARHGEGEEGKGKEGSLSAHAAFLTGRAGSAGTALDGPPESGLARRCWRLHLENGRGQSCLALPCLASHAFFLPSPNLALLCPSMHASCTLPCLSPPGSMHATARLCAAGRYLREDTLPYLTVCPPR